MITLSHFELARIAVYAFALGCIIMLFLTSGREMSKPQVALYSIAGTAWFVLLLYHFFK